MKKSSSLKPFGQMNRNLVGSTYGRFCIKFPQSRMKGERYRPTEPLVIELECMCIGASYQVLVQLAIKQFQGRRFFEIDQSETRIACGSHVCKRIGTK
jgi:hypothetical protein